MEYVVDHWSHTLCQIRPVSKLSTLQRRVLLGTAKVIGCDSWWFGVEDLFYYLISTEE